MDKIRVANTSYLSSTPYRFLRDCKYVSYEENIATENARKLHEGEVDLALIPTSDFALHGCYVGLDFGISCEGGTDLLSLYTMDDIEALRRVYMYASSSSSCWLLRLLLHFKWGLRPRLIRSFSELTLDEVSPSDGLLIRQTSWKPEFAKFHNKFDLVEEWQALTGSPFVFLIWATRPGVLSSEQTKLVTSDFHRFVRAFQQSEREQKIRDAHMLDEVQYYLDDQYLEALTLAFQLGKEAGMLPSLEYQSSRYRLMDGQSSGLFVGSTLSEIYTSLVQNERISVEHAVKLAQEAPLSDLMLLNEQVKSTLRVQVRSERRIEISEGGDHGERRLSTDKDTWIRFACNQLELASLTSYEEELASLANTYNCPIEGFTAWSVKALADKEGLSMGAVISRLVDAGLSGLSPMGGEMLLDHGLKKESGKRAADWLEVFALAHGAGMSTTATMRLSAQDCWRDRFTHLHKLRQLEDENPGFRYISFSINDDGKPLDEMFLLRAALVTQLFFDNCFLAKEVNQTGTVRELLPLQTCGGRLISLDKDLPSSSIVPYLQDASASLLAPRN